MSFPSLCCVLGIAFVVVSVCAYFRLVIKDKNSQIDYYRKMWVDAVEQLQEYRNTDRLLSHSEYPKEKTK